MASLRECARDVRDDLADGIDRLHEIIAADPDAVLLNGYYTNVGCDEDGTMPGLDVLARAIRWQYEECYMLASNWELREAP